MPALKSHESFVKEAKEKHPDFTVLSTYQGNKKHIDVRHDTCGVVFSVRGDNFLQNASCPNCRGQKRRTPEMFEKEVASLGNGEYEVLTPFERVVKKISLRHKVCGYRYTTTPLSFLSGHRCPKCAGVLKKTPEEFIRSVRERVGTAYSVLSDYTSALEKVKMRHNACGHVWFVSPHNFLHRKSRCPKCNRPGRPKKAV